MKKYKPMRFDDFRNIKAGDEVFCMIGNKITRETAARDAFYNYDADAPEWEIETENGYFCWDCVFVWEE